MIGVAETSAKKQRRYNLSNVSKIVDLSPPLADGANSLHEASVNLSTYPIRFEDHILHKVVVDCPLMRGEYVSTRSDSEYVSAPVFSLSNTSYRPTEHRESCMGGGRLEEKVQLPLDSLPEVPPSPDLDSTGRLAGTGNINVPHRLDHSPVHEASTPVVDSHGRLSGIGFGSPEIPSRISHPTPVVQEIMSPDNPPSRACRSIPPTPLETLMHESYTHIAPELQPMSMVPLTPLEVILQEASCTQLPMANAVPPTPLEALIKESYNPLVPEDRLSNISEAPPRRLDHPPEPTTEEQEPQLSTEDIKHIFADENPNDLLPLPKIDPALISADNSPITTPIQPVSRLALPKKPINIIEDEPFVPTPLIQARAREIMEDNAPLTHADIEGVEDLLANARDSPIQVRRPRPVNKPSQVHSAGDLRTQSEVVNKPSIPPLPPLQSESSSKTQSGSLQPSVSVKPATSVDHPAGLSQSQPPSGTRNIDAVKSPTPPADKDDKSPSVSPSDRQDLSRKNSRSVLGSAMGKEDTKSARGYKSSENVKKLITNLNETVTRTIGGRNAGMSVSDIDDSKSVKSQILNAARMKKRIEEQFPNTDAYENDSGKSIDLNDIQANFAQVKKQNQILDADKVKKQILKKGHSADETHGGTAHQHFAHAPEHNLLRLHQIHPDNMILITRQVWPRLCLLALAFFLTHIFLTFINS